MTVSHFNSQINYIGTNVAGQVFPVPFNFVDDADLSVVVTDLNTGIQQFLNRNIDYTQTGAGSLNGGTVTMLQAWPNTKRISVSREPLLLQPLDLVENDSFSAESVEKELDRIVYQMQSLSNALSRCIRTPLGDLTVPILANIQTRAGKYLGFDGVGALSYLAGTIAPTITDSALLTYLRTESGAVQLTVRDRLSLEIHVEDFGAKGDYDPVAHTGTDDTVAIQKALDAAHAAGGGVVLLGPGRFKYTNYLIIWPNVTLAGQGNPSSGFINLGTTPWTNPGIDPEANGGVRFTNMRSSLWCCFDAGRGDGTGVYNVSDAVGLPNIASRTGSIEVRGAIQYVNIFQYSYANFKLAAYTDAATFNSAWNSGFMSGVAIRFGADDARVENCFIGGFMQAAVCYFNNRPNFLHNLVDCINGIEISVCTDCARIEGNVTIGCSIGYSLGSLVRRGTFIYIHDTVDWPYMVNNFTYGHKTGVYISNVNFPQITNFGADNIGGAEFLDYYGIRFAGTVNQPMINGFVSGPREYGIRSDINAACTLRAQGITTAGVRNSLYVDSGHVELSGAHLAGDGVNPGITNVGAGSVNAAGVRVSGHSLNWQNTSTGTVNVAGYSFHGCTIGAVAAGSTVFLGPGGASVTETLAQWVAPHNGILSIAYSKTDVAPGAGKNYTYTVRKNGADTTVTWAQNGAAATSGSDAAHQIAVNQGDLITIKCVLDAASAAPNFHYFVKIDA